MVCTAPCTEAGVAAIPVSAFYEGDPVTTIARLCFSKADATLDEGVARPLGAGLRPARVDLQRGLEGALGARLVAKDDGQAVIDVVAGIVGLKLFSGAH